MWVIFWLVLAVFLGKPVGVAAQSCGGCGSFLNWVLHGCGPSGSIACQCDNDGYWTIRQDCSDIGQVCHQGQCIDYPTCQATGFTTSGKCKSGCDFDTEYSLASADCGDGTACCIPRITPTLVPTATNTLRPTNTVRPSNTPIPTATQTPRPTSTNTPRPTNTVRPTNNPTIVPTQTPRPTSTNTPGPTDTIRPTETVRPTATRTTRPTNTISPTNTTVPTATGTQIPTSTNIPTMVPTNTIASTVTPMPTPTIQIITQPTINSFCDADGHGANSDDPRIDTAIGCLPITFDKLVDYLLPYVLGMAGGVSFLLMVYGYATVAMAAGDPKLIAGGRETVKTAAEGLGIAILAIFVMRFVLLTVLRIPGIF